MRLSILISISYFLFQNNLAKSQESVVNATPFTYWQQHVDYKMEIDFDIETYQYRGTQKLVYTNNSPNVLSKVFYHLYFNAFQPGSEMDIRLQNIPDPDLRMVRNVGTGKKPIYQSLISTLKPEEMGFVKINALSQNGSKVTYQIEGTILEVTLKTPILSGEKSVFEMEFLSQVPSMIRRSGRSNKEGLPFP